MKPIRRSHRRIRLAAALSLTLLFTCAMAGSAMARTKIYKSVPTRVSFSATRAADGTITAQTIFTSPNPRCLEGKRFLEKHKDGNYWITGGFLYYGGPFSEGAFSAPFGADGAGSPPNKGFLVPVSPAGKSPYVWQAVWPGDTSILVTNRHNPSLERHYASTPAAASGVSMRAVARASKGQGLPYYKVAYNQGKNHIVLKCGTLTEAASSDQFTF